MKSMPPTKLNFLILILMSAATLGTLMFLSNEKALAQTPPPPPRGRMWVAYPTSLSGSGSNFGGFVHIYNTSNNELLGSTYMGPNGLPNGNGNIRGVAFDPSDGSFWFSSLLAGSINPTLHTPGGDGLIHKKPALGGSDTTTIPDPGGVGGPGIGALDYDPEENALWAVTHWSVNGQLTFYKLNPNNGAVLKTFSFSFESKNCCTNVTLAVARPADLGGVKVLLTTTGLDAPLKLYALDVNTGALLKIYENSEFAGVYGIDVDDITGDLIVVNNELVFNLGPAPYTGNTLALTIENRFPYAWADMSLENPTPLIFIPGIAGSELNKTSGTIPNLWLGAAALIARTEPYKALTLDPSQPQEQNDIFAPDVLRTLVYDKVLTMLKDPFSNTRGGYIEYAVAGNPSRRTTAGCDLNQRSNRPTLFVFAYDWRKSNAENAAVLADYVGCVQKFFSPGTKVNILTHSMGGLVARRYILDNPGKVNKLVTVAAPWLGAPKANYVLETGEFFDAVKIQKFIEDFKTVSEFFPGVHELFPSRSYFSLGGRPFGEAGFDLNGNRQKFETYSTYDQYLSMLNHRFPRPTSVLPQMPPATTGRLFHDYPGQDDWRTDQTDVRYYHIFSSQTLRGTIGKIIAVPEKKCSPLGTDCITKVGFKTEKVFGDGTVPFLSTSRRSGSTDLNKPDATLNGTFNFSHTDIIRANSVHKEILNYLRGPGSMTPQLQLQQAVAPAKTFDEDSPAAQQAYYLTIDGVDSVFVEDCCGNNNAPIEEGVPFTNEVPGVNIDLLGEKVFEVTMPTSIDLAVIDFTVTFRSGTEPLFIELIKGDGKGAPSLARRYRDLNLPPGVLIQFKITEKGGIDDLRYDANDDGTFETVIPPTVSLEGTPALDVEPPAINITGTYQQNGALVAITATDGGSGLKSLRYSLDGTHYQPYAGPFTVNFAQHHAVYAYADDFAANRRAEDVLELRPSFSPAVQYVTVGGGSGGADLIVPSGFNWTVSNNDNWIILTSASTGSGEDRITFEARENLTGGARSGTLIIAGIAFTIVQDGGLGEDCVYVITPTSKNFTNSGGTGTIDVFSEQRCAWLAVSNRSWITITSGNAGIGNGVVTYSVEVNTSGSARAGTITVAGKTFPIKQK